MGCLKLVLLLMLGCTLMHQVKSIDYDRLCDQCDCAAFRITCDGVMIVELPDLSNEASLRTLDLRQSVLRDVDCAHLPNNLKEVKLINTDLPAERKCELLSSGCEGKKAKFVLDERAKVVCERKSTISGLTLD